MKPRNMQGNIHHGSGRKDHKRNTGEKPQGRRPEERFGMAKGKVDRNLEEK